MIAKVITSDKREYFSYVFAILNSGFDTAFITFDNNLNKFEYINMYIGSPSLIRKVFIIDTDEGGFVKRDELLIDQILYKPVLGYDWILNKGVLNNIIKNIDVEKKFKNIAIKFNNKIEKQEWNYVNSKKDADNLLALAWGFHDSEINEIKYNQKNGYDDYSSVTVKFSGSWDCEITLVFEHDILIHYSMDDNLSTEILGASILFNDGYIYWADDLLDDISEIDSILIYFRARSLKWKFTTNFSA